MIPMLKRRWRPRRATVAGFPPTQVISRRYQPRGHLGLTLHWLATEPEQMRALRDAIYAPLALDLQSQEPARYPVLAATTRGHATLHRVSDTLEPGHAYEVSAEFVGIGPLWMRRTR